jgi:misacylated tRNA(Ala) deacylase
MPLDSTPTDELAARDSYLAVAEGTIREIVGNGVVLDRTPFYVRGGGQPGDTGAIKSHDDEIRVTDTLRKGGKVIHVVSEPHKLQPGMPVECAIDWDRRYAIMRTHTALHALSGVVWRDYGAKVTGGDMKAGTARMDFELEGISREFGREVERQLNLELVKGYPAEVLWMARPEALRDPDLIRTKVNLIPEWVQDIRVIDIVGLDRQADGGTHVRSTLEVGAVRVVKTESKGRANKRMRIALA